MDILKQLTRCKPISQTHLTKKGQLGWVQLLIYGIAATVGSGIYVIIGRVARFETGPAVILSVLLSGALMCVTALIYLDLVVLVPEGVSSYSYGYAFLGEMWAWLLGWISTLAYAFAGSSTAISFSFYFSKLFGLEPITIAGFHVNYVAGTITLLVSIVVCGGITVGTTANNLLSAVNMSILLFIIGVGCYYANPGENWDPFFLTQPIIPTEPIPGGVFRGVLTMVYIFVGFETICVLSEKAKGPRHIQIAVVGTVCIATLLYMGVGFILTSMIPLALIDPSTPLASAFESLGLIRMSYIVTACALLMLVATLLVCLIGQPEVFRVMAVDGLMPPIFKRMKRGVPLYNTIICCLFSAFLAMFISAGSLFDVISVGSLVCYSVSALCVLFARIEYTPIKQVGNPYTMKSRLSHDKVKIWTKALSVFYIVGNLFAWLLIDVGRPIFLISMVLGVVAPFISLVYLFWSRFENWDRPTFCPWMPLVPCLCISGNTFILSTVPRSTWLQFSIWTAFGVILYFCYGCRHSKLEDPVLNLNI